MVRTSGDQPAPAEVPGALMDAGASQQQASSLDPASLSAHLAVEELQVPKPRVAGCERCPGYLQVATLQFKALA